MTARVQLTWKDGDPEAFALEAGAGLPRRGGDEDPEIASARLAKARGDWVLTLVFIPWSPGLGRVPAMTVGETALPALRYSTAEAASGAALAGPRPQRDPPGAALYLYGFIAVLLVIAALVLAFLFWVLPGARELLARWKARAVWSSLSSTLDWLEANGGEGDQAPSYALLSRALRVYLARRLIDEAEALTPRELAGLPAERFPGARHREALVEILGEADQARFAGIARGGGDLAGAVRRARGIARAVEEAVGVRA